MSTTQAAAAFATGGSSILTNAAASGTTASVLVGGGCSAGAVIPPPPPARLTRAVSVTGHIESKRQTISEMMSEIRWGLLFYIRCWYLVFLHYLFHFCCVAAVGRKYDPYPCILGIPIMPALFNGSKFYIFICFVLLGTRTMVSVMREIW
jgi:hypothetical protein